jgi:hypothetical protein
MMAASSARDASQAVLAIIFSIVAVMGEDHTASGDAAAVYHGC